MEALGRCQRWRHLDGSIWGGWLVDQSSVSSAGASQKKRKAVLRKESAETQEYESCLQTQDYVSCQDMEEDDNKSLQAMDFVPSAVSDSAGWHEPLRVKYMSDKKCNEEGFKL